MTFGDIPEVSLKTVLGETYEGGDYNLENELNSLGEDIIKTNIMQLPGTGRAIDLSGLTVYTETYVGIIIHGVFGDLTLVKLKRNP